MNPEHPVYVISKGRWQLRPTSKALEAMRVPYRIVIEPQEYEHYVAVIDPRKILVLPFSNLGQGSIPARNWVWEHAISEGYARHWILDDNIRQFYRLNQNQRNPVKTGATFKAAEDFVERYKNVALAGFNTMVLRAIPKSTRRLSSIRVFTPAFSSKMICRFVGAVATTRTLTYRYKS